MPKRGGAQAGGGGPQRAWAESVASPEVAARSRKPAGGGARGIPEALPEAPEAGDAVVVL